MLYGLYPSAKRKYSYLNQLVGSHIVKTKKKKKTSQPVSPLGDEQLQCKAIAGEACQSSRVTLRDNAHIGKVTGASMHTCHQSRVGAVNSHKGGVCFLPLWKQLCRHAQNVGWVKGNCSCGEMGDFGRKGVQSVQLQVVPFKL